MCGLAGFITIGGGPARAMSDVLQRMCATLVHRGPDDQGEWVDASAGVAIGFRRLAILDLSTAGHQPMVSASGRYVATLNGEIYNFEALREQLASLGHTPAYRGHSDTEVMLAAIDAWGIHDAVTRFNGMFALAIWDALERRLFLVRDRVGVKPLYYGRAGRTFLYGSELKAFLANPAFDPRIDRASVDLLLRFTYVPAPRSIYEGVAKVRPGTIVSFDPQTETVRETVYWSVRDAVARGVARPFQGSEEEASVEVERLVRDAVKLRMVADVPLGVFLSGGIDSSLVTALAQAQSSSPVRTFSIGFRDASHDESAYARLVATCLGTDHAEMSLTTDDAMNVIPKLPAMYDEPFADSSQIPTHLVASLARRFVTVALSGDGGDELFGGYTRYLMGARMPEMLRVPSSVRSMLGWSIRRISPRGWDRLLRAGGTSWPLMLRAPQAGERLHKMARVLGSSDGDALYFELVSHWSGVVIGADSPAAIVDERDAWPALPNPVDRMMFFDQISYLPDDILAKVDRASMAVSLEAREPLLDYRLVELAWTLPASMKIRAGRGKPILRRILSRYLPESLVERPKMGFGVPLAEWLRGGLRGWAESLLDERLIRQQGWLDPVPIRAKWEAHVSGKADWKYHLWAVLMFQAWLQAQGKRS